MKPFAIRPLSSLALVTVALLAACGSGGGGADVGGSSAGGGTQPGFVTWSATGNSSIFDNDNDRFAVRSDTRQVYDMDRQVTIGNWRVTSSTGSGSGFVLFQDGVEIGSVYAHVAPNGTFSVFGSRSGNFLDVQVDGTGYRWVETSRRISSSSGGAGGSTGGTGSGGSTGGSGSGGSTGGSGSTGGGSSSITFINWTNSANGVVVKDASNDNIRFRADTRQMYISPYTISNCYVDSAAQLYWNNQDIGSVALVNGSGGYRIAALVSNRGNLIDIFESGGQIYWRESSITGRVAGNAAAIGDLFDSLAKPAFAEEDGTETLDCTMDETVTIESGMSELFALESWELQGLFTSDQEELDQIEASLVDDDADCRTLAEAKDH